MWEHYKKRFWGMQALIAAVVGGMFWMAGRNPAVAGMFLLTMEVSSVLGAAWASRLKKKYQGQIS